MIRRKSISDLFASLTSSSQSTGLDCEEGNSKFQTKSVKGGKEYKVGGSTFFTKGKNVKRSK